MVHTVTEGNPTARLGPLRPQARIRDEGGFAVSSFFAPESRSRAALFWRLCSLADVRGGVEQAERLLYGPRAGGLAGPRRLGSARTRVTTSPPRTAAAWAEDLPLVPGSPQFASSLVCTVIRSGWLSADS